ELLEDDRSFLTDEDFELAKQLHPAVLYSKDRNDIILPQYVLYFIDKYRGDIVGKAAARKNFNFKRSRKLRRNGVRLVYDKWPNGTIPYVISQRYNTRERAILARAFNAFHDRTCIRFVPQQGERDYLFIGKIDGCYSDVGRAGGRQELSLDDGCMQYDTATHEFMHAIDAYDQFGKVNTFESDNYGEPYDYYSVRIMHYDRKAFSKNGLFTIEAKKPGMTYVMGTGKELSPVDLRKLNKMYNCPYDYFLNIDRNYYKYNTNINSNNNNNFNIHFSPPKVQQQQGFPSQNILPAMTLEPVMTPNACRDKGTLCYLWAAQCQAPQVKWLLRTFCPFTCGYCNERLLPESNNIARALPSTFNPSIFGK
uniref:Metalloendopeptidase n=1 Tax=Romanomermis culicivorax TaxID=13658 RepID=A0A915L116_ROMCU